MPERQENQNANEPMKYDHRSVEAKWQARWEEAKLFRAGDDPNKPKFYGLEFFPYPSGAGLSVGHCRNYIPVDAICRMKAMQGYNVLHPMGWDAFGQPAENEAIKTGSHPKFTVPRYAATYKKQFKLMGIGYDWEREVNSSDPSFYHWTQWFFLLLFKRGLAYRSDAPANWCPVDKTVLANEEVKDGRCWRCGAQVEKKALPQWFFKITDYAERLSHDLDTVDWPEGIKLQQRNWIGKSIGVEFDMEVFGTEEKLRVFTTRIDTVYGMSFAVMSPEHPMLEKITAQENLEGVREYAAKAKQISEQDRLAADRERTGVFTGSYAINPVNGEKAPIYAADYVLMGYGTGAIMAVPAHDTRDFDFATRYNLPIPQVISPERDALDIVQLPYIGDGFLVGSGEWSGTPTDKAQITMADWFQTQGWGVKKVNFRLRDWLISRQRYWGAPIPIIHCPTHGAVAVPDEQLPVLLPDVDKYQPTGTGESPLAAIPEFVNTVCPVCGDAAQRETDTMAGFACSSWYFLRFADPTNSSAAFNKEKAEYWLPVDLYVGGAEHAVMHLLYARFWTKVMHDAGLVSFIEPFTKLVNQGMLLAHTPGREAFADEKTNVEAEDAQGKWVPLTPEERETYPKEKIIWKYVKMSKSLKNVITPDEIAELYGVDALRVYEMFVAPFDQAIQWDDKGILGAARFIGRIWRLLTEFRSNFVDNWRETGTPENLTEAQKTLRRKTHQSIKKTLDDLENFRFNTAVSSMMEWVNAMQDFSLLKDSSAAGNLVMSETAELFILTLAPIAPHIADEMWEFYGFEGFTYNQQLPVYDADAAAEESITIAIQINGKLRDTITVPVGMADEEIKSAALSQDKVFQHIEGKEIRRVIVVPQKLINIVVR